MKNKVTAVLLAGGKGTRFDPDYLKTLHIINGEALAEMVIKDIKSSNLFDEIILVFNEDYESQFQKIIKKEKIVGVKNGKSRFFSAKNGIEIARNEKVIVIDVAAPFYQHVLLKEMIKKLNNYNGVMSVSLETRRDFVYIEGEEIKNVFTRGLIFGAKSYQGLKKSIWLDIVNKTPKDETENYSEMLKVFVDNKVAVTKVLNLENKFKKITTKEDLKLFDEITLKK